MARPFGLPLPLLPAAMAGFDLNAPPETRQEEEEGVLNATQEEEVVVFAQEEEDGGLNAEEEEQVVPFAQEEEQAVLNSEEEEQADDFDLKPLDEFGTVDMDFLQNMTEHSAVVENHRRREMTEDMRKQVCQALLAGSNNSKLHKKDAQIVAQQFDLHVRSVRRVWNRGKIQLANSVPVVVASLKKGRVGRKATPVDLEVLRNIRVKDRMTLEDVCAKLNMSKWKMILKKGLLRRHSSSIKPYLTEGIKKTRLKFCNDMIKRGLNGDPSFREFFDFVFIDEKWFYLYQKSEKNLFATRRR